MTFSFVAIISEFANISKDMPPHQRGQHVALVAVTLFVSWLMTHTTFAFRYAHEFYEVDDDSTGGHLRRAWNSPVRSSRTISISCISRWCWA